MHMFLNGTNDFVKVRKRLQITYLPVDLCFQELKLKFRKLMRLFSKTDICAFRLSLT